MPQRSINIGNGQCREYLSLNRSPLFQALPQKDFAQIQKDSYDFFLNKRLKGLLDLYFPAEFSDYNNKVSLTIKDLIINPPTISLEEAKDKQITWQNVINLKWLIKWDCQKIQIPLVEIKKGIEENIKQWIEKGFKIGKFSLKKVNEKKWEAKDKKENWKLLINILVQESDHLSVKFYCEQEKEIFFCHLPKITLQGDFIINGHNKVVVFQSVRAPGAYFMNIEEDNLIGEIIPLKGSWFRIYLDNFKKSKEEKETKSGIKIKFLNTGSVFTLSQILKTSFTEESQLTSLLGSEEVLINSYNSSIPVGKEEKILPQFLFDKKNSYFSLGALGRKKFNQKMNVFERLWGQTLAEDLQDKQGKIILACNSLLTEKKIKQIQKAIDDNKLLPLPLSADLIENDLYLFKVYSPLKEKKKVHILGITKDLPEEKTYFDLTDFLCMLSYYLNLTHGIGKLEKEAEKDKLEFQIIRQVGDLIYNIFDNRLGNFLHSIDRGYLASISQLEKADLAKIPHLNDFEGAIRKFFYISFLAQLQNEINPIASAAYRVRGSVLGPGGYSSVNASPITRDIKPDDNGRYDLVETPEGAKVYLIRSLTLNAQINKYGQITASYYKVKKGKIVAELVHLSSEEEYNKYITHCHLSINENNEIEAEKVTAWYQNSFVLVAKDKIEYIYSSFYHLNSLVSSAIIGFNFNSATRMLMATNMLKQVVGLKGEAPLVISGMEENLLNNDYLTIKNSSSGIVEYVDSKKIIVKEKNKKEKEYSLKQFLISNKNLLFFSHPLVKKGEEVTSGQLLACGDYEDKQILSLGHNLRVAFLCWEGNNFEDAIVINKRLVEEGKFTSLYVKEYTVIRKKTKHGEEVFTASILNSREKKTDHLDEEGIVKLGTEVEAGDILVGKITPEPSKKTETQETILLRELFGEKAENFVDSSLYLPWGEKGVVCSIKRWDKKYLEKMRKENNANYSRNDLGLIKIAIVWRREVEEGDKFTSRFGNKGVIGRIVPYADMPFDKDGAVDIVINPLSIPSRMNIGQLIESVLGLAAKKLGIKILMRPFNNISFDSIQELMKEAKITDFGLTKMYDGRTGLPFAQKVYVGYNYYCKLGHMSEDKFNAQNTGPYSPIYQQPTKGRKKGGRQRAGEMEEWALAAHGATKNLAEMNGPKSDDIHGRRLLRRSIIFGDRSVDLRSNQSESFNITLQYLRSLGLDLKAFDYNDKEIDFYKIFSKT